MKFSRNWLQDYSKEPLPAVKDLEETVTLNAFEIESVEMTGNDAVLDIKVLPNRAHDALGHRGMARDICALVGNTFQDPNEYYEGEGDNSIIVPVIATEDGKACTRFMSVRIDGTAVTESPAWLKTKLNAIGQKSINSIVDITNFVQFSINKPMHAYDANLIAGNMLSARFAKAGEKLTTLDDKSLELDESTLVIADSEKPLGLAGIKGGKFSGISSSTASVVLESANFNPTLIRKTSQKYGIRTDASKRFENEIADELVEEGLRMTIALIQKLNPKAKVGAIIDVWNRPTAPFHVGISVDEVNKVLGTSYLEKEITDVFDNLGFSYKKVIPEEEMLMLADRALEAPYHLGSSVRFDSPDQFDCSSLTSWLYVHSGIKIPRMSIDQYVYTKRIDSGDLRIGDLIFSDNNQDPVYTTSIEFMSGTPVPGGINHVGVYVGEGNVIHATKQYMKVVKENLGTSARFQSITGYGRVVEDLHKERILVTVPEERLDIRIKEDLIEEVARMKGLASIPAILPNIGRVGVPHKRLYYENKIKKILNEAGFSEILTYSFGDMGEVEIVKGSAMDKEKLRTDLATGLTKAFQMNMLNAPLLNIRDLKMYEFGNVFTRNDERRHFALIIDGGKKKTSFSEEVDLLLSQIKRELGVDKLECETKNPKPYCIELDFDTLIASLPEPASYEPLIENQAPVAYQSVSPYPFIVRDIAVWVPDGITWEDIRALAVQIDSPWIIRIDCFDTFQKEIDGVKKTSYAFRFVLQAKDKTLTDAQANEVADKMYALLKEKGYEIR
jgi:phenylalanyl-tRNA synthetase beta subunit